MRRYQTENAENVIYFFFFRLSLLLIPVLSTGHKRILGLLMETRLIEELSCGS